MINRHLYIDSQTFIVYSKYIIREAIMENIIILKRDHQQVKFKGEKLRSLLKRIRFR